jgi:hypothetical protein
LLGHPRDLKAARECLSVYYFIQHEYEDNPEDHNNALWENVIKQELLETGDHSRRLWNPSPFLEKVLFLLLMMLLLVNIYNS